jgi:hypothetical protein
MWREHGSPSGGGEEGLAIVAVVGRICCGTGGSPPTTVVVVVVVVVIVVVVDDAAGTVVVVQGHKEDTCHELPHAVKGDAVPSGGEAMAAGRERPRQAPRAGGS